MNQSSSKLEPFCHKGYHQDSETTTSKEKRKATHRMIENICKSYLDKGLVCRIYKEFLFLNNFKMGKGFE